MKNLLLTKKQFIIFIGTGLLITIPYFLLTVFGLIKNESGLILILPFLGGQPWLLLYLILPFDIPGITSAGQPDQTGNIVFSLFDLLLLMIPVYINIYILVRLISGGVKPLSSSGSISAK